MKKLFFIVSAILTVSAISAPPPPRGHHPGPRPMCYRPAPPPPPHHHHHHYHDPNPWPGIVGGIIGGVIVEAVKPTPTVVVQQPAPVVVQTPVVVQPQQTYVPGRYVDTVQPNGTVVRTWVPAHYEVVR